RRHLCGAPWRALSDQRLGLAACPLDHANFVNALAFAFQQRLGLRRVLARYHDHHADAAIEYPPHLRFGDIARLLQPAEELEARPSSRSPGTMARPSMIRACSTTPTQKPARSYSPAMNAFGCSAVSPPTSAQPASSQPAAMPFTTWVATRTSRRSQT